MSAAWCSGLISSLLRPNIASSQGHFLWPCLLLVGKSRQPTQLAKHIGPRVRCYSTSDQGSHLLHKRSARVMTTPSKLFKLVLPLPTPSQQLKDTTLTEQDLEKDGATADSPARQIALLIHPAQPLSHLASLIQAELPPNESNGRAPSVSFYTALNYAAAKKIATNVENLEMVSSQDGANVEGSQKFPDTSMCLWSGSTEMGDFVRDAAATPDEEEKGITGGFLVSLEGYDEEGIWVFCPSFNDRTYYLRARYKRICTDIEGMLGLKQKCDSIARRSAHQIAVLGFTGLIAWWGLVYFMTFVRKDTYGWDVMEPVTYLVGLSTIAGGYLFFLARNREVSYRSLLETTISRRQMALYEKHGFDVEKWDELVADAKDVRREIKKVAAEYGVRWDGNGVNDLNQATKEEEEASKKVGKLLKKEEKKSEKSKDEDQSEEDDDSDSSASSDKEKATEKTSS